MDGIHPVLVMGRQSSDVWCFNLPMFCSWPVGVPGFSSHHLCLLVVIPPATVVLS